MRSDKSFKEFLRSGYSLTLIACVFVLGILLVLFSSSGSAVKSETSREDELAELCSSVEGVGRCRTVITCSDEDGAVYAVAVICEGADSVKVRERVNKLISSLYGIGSNRIAVLKID